jgi:hypothetical protein
MFGIGIVGVTSNVLVFVSTDINDFTCSMILLYSLFIANTIICGYGLIFGLVNAIQRYWFFGVSGCIIASWISTFVCCVSIFLLSAMAIEKLITIKYQKTLSKSQVYYWIGAVVILALTISMMPYYTFTSDFTIALHPAKLNCNFTMWSFNIVTTVLILVFCGIISIAMAAMVYSYYQISTFFKSVLSKQMRAAIADKEHEIVVKNVLISGSFIVFWSPYIIKVVYEVIAKIPVPAEIDATCVFLALLNSALNPVIVYFTDARIRRNIRGFLSLSVVNSDDGKHISFEASRPFGTAFESQAQDQSLSV